MAKIEGSRVLVTGGSSGIGRATCIELAKRGAILALTARRLKTLRKVSDEIKDAFPDVQAPLLIPCDVSDREDAIKLVKKCVDHLGGIDILINNAGIGVYGKAEMTALDDFRSVMEVNFFGSVNLILEVLPHMKKTGGGLIINIASVAAMHGVPYMGAYCASKAALVALSQSLRAELATSGISIMIVYPGYTQTNFFRVEKKVGGARRPAGRYVPAKKVARSIVNAIENERQDLVLTLEGKALKFSKVFIPWLAEGAMQRIAYKLADKKEV
ncbi:MAG: SDR family NAD(P)-dependent oxidoreductase [Candidatus Aminicenantes bacterium]|nr:SDR family NAD(P)-dependent oxidoreductase [Candidatus Aminicenantes bacterium]